MPIFLPETTQSSAGTLTPRQIVAELDKHVVGQAAAKRAVAIALRNRMRRQKLTPELAAGAPTLVTMGSGDQCSVVPGVTMRRRAIHAGMRPGRGLVRRLAGLMRLARLA